MVRDPAVAGQFYAFDADTLRREVQRYLSISGPGKVKGEILAGIAPHAGHMYSGSVAAYLYNALKQRQTETFVIIGPNHSGMGAGVSIYPEGSWLTPMGEVAIDSGLSSKLARGFSADADSHLLEHSIEVQLPFLQECFDNFKIVPICVMQQDMEAMQKLGEALANYLDPEKHVVIASTDFSHYVPYETAYAEDLRVIEKIKELDVQGMYKTIDEHAVSMCGFGPVAAAMAYAKEKGAKKGELLKYSTSGDVAGDNSAVVGYGALVLTT